MLIFIWKLFHITQCLSILYQSALSVALLSLVQLSSRSLTQTLLSSCQFVIESAQTAFSWRCCFRALLFWLAHLVWSHDHFVRTENLIFDCFWRCLSWLSSPFHLCRSSYQLQPWICLSLCWAIFDLFCGWFPLWNLECPDETTWSSFEYHLT